MTRSATETLTAATGIKTTLGTLVSVGSSIIGAVIWCTYMYVDVQTLKKNDEDKAKALVTMTEKLSNVEADVKHIRWLLDPTASRPVLASPTHTSTVAPTP
jgi:hypothetical protein